MSVGDRDPRTTTPPQVVPAEGTKLSMESGSPGTFVDVAGVIRIGSQKTKVNPVKTTKLVSTYQEYRPGRIPDMGEVVFRIQYDPNNADHQLMYTSLESGTITNWKITYADGLSTNASVTFAGFLTTIEEDDKEDEANVEADVTMQITGPPTRTPGTP